MEVDEIVRLYYQGKSKASLAGTVKDEYLKQAKKAGGTDQSIKQAMNIVEVALYEHYKETYNRTN